jgi:hypothetical protein
MWHEAAGGTLAGWYWGLPPPIPLPNDREPPTCSKQQVASLASQEGCSCAMRASR